MFSKIGLSNKFQLVRFSKLISVNTKILVTINLIFDVGEKTSQTRTHMRSNPTD